MTQQLQKGLNKDALRGILLRVIRAVPQDDDGSFQKRIDESIDNIMTSADKDHNNIIAKHEFVEACRLLDREARSIEMRQMYNQLNGDGNGNGS